MSYQSPIDACYQDINAIVSRQVEDGIIQAVQRVGFHVDREELERALLYDRGQYEKGFRDGVASTLENPVRHGHWEDCCCSDSDVFGDPVLCPKKRCSLCGKTNKNYAPPYCPHCGAKMDEEEK